MSDTTRARKAPEKKAVVEFDAPSGVLTIGRPRLNEGAGPKWLMGEIVLKADLHRIEPSYDGMTGMAQLVLGHGLKQKLADAFAGPDADVSEAVDMWEQLVDGDWDSGRSGTGLPRFFAEAYAAVRGVAIETVRPRINAILSGDDLDKMANLRQWAADPRIRAAAEKIKAAKAAERAKAAVAAAKNAPVGALEDI